jgi:hypothetical protein
MQQLVEDVADAIRAIDRSATPFKQFRPGVGPYGEPQLTKLIAKHLLECCGGRYPRTKTCRVPDVLIPEQWAIEFKIARPFGDNGKEAEHWSQNLLHPYPGNISAIGDAYKLLQREGIESRAIVVIGYEHDPPIVAVTTLISAFEILCRNLLNLPLGSRHTAVVDQCIHPIHQRATLYGWTLS